jgi:serine-type D-Ala-D-Ala carboxypeptidase (penicillin-binding protein 5/6)
MGSIVVGVQLATVRRGLGFVLLLVACAAAGLLAPAARADVPPVDASAFLVAGGPSGEVLVSRDAEARVPIASITKLMTAIVTLEHARPGETVTIGAPASVVGESTINLQAGEQLTVRDLLAGALIQSANDAAFALASYVGHGDVNAFVRLMNRKARELGLRDTHFVRPDGLDAPGHLSSARDVLRLARVAMRRPLIRSLVRQRTARIAGGRRLLTWNDLLGRHLGVVGVKTGHTSAAGWCEVAAARRNGTTVYAVLLGSPERETRNQDLAELLDWGFEQFVRVAVVTEGRTYATAAVPFSHARVPLVAGGAASTIVRVGHSLVETVVATAMVDAPVRKGQRLGEVRISDAGRVAARVPLVAARDVAVPGFGTKTGWYAGRTADEAEGMFSDVFGSFL